jgi:hypothetical protein
MKYLITLAASLILFQVASSQVKTNFTKQNYEKFFLPDCIPKDLTANGHILIIKSPFESDINSKIEEIFKAYYKSPFIVTTAKFTNMVWASTEQQNTRATKGRSHMHIML